MAGSRQIDRRLQAQRRRLRLGCRCLRRCPCLAENRQPGGSRPAAASKLLGVQLPPAKQDGLVGRADSVAAGGPRGCRRCWPCALRYRRLEPLLQLLPCQGRVRRRRFSRRRGAVWCCRGLWDCCNRGRNGGIHGRGSSPGLTSYIPIGARFTVTQLSKRIWLSQQLEGQHIAMSKGLAPPPTAAARARPARLHTTLKEAGRRVMALPCARALFEASRGLKEIRSGVFLAAGSGRSAVRWRAR